MTTKRIPIGTHVTWKARYATDPVNEGIVTALPDPRHRFPVYIVKVDKTPAGNPRKHPISMRPYACRLEAQNPDALK